LHHRTTASSYGGIVARLDKRSRATFAARGVAASTASSRSSSDGTPSDAGGASGIAGGIQPPSARPSGTGVRGDVVPTALAYSGNVGGHAAGSAAPSRRALSHRRTTSPLRSIAKQPAVIMPRGR
jgi:hypothetical protein